MAAHTMSGNVEANTDWADHYLGRLVSPDAVDVGWTGSLQPSAPTISTLAGGCSPMMPWDMAHSPRGCWGLSPSSRSNGDRPESAVARWGVSEVDLLLHCGDLAVLAFCWERLNNDDGATVSGRATVVLQQFNHRWLCVHSHFSANP